MTDQQINSSQGEVLAVAISEKKAADALRSRLFVIGERLESLGRALKEHPEEITPTPDPSSIYDYREGLNHLDRLPVVEGCKELHRLLASVKRAEKRISMLLGGTVQNLD